MKVAIMQPYLFPYIGYFQLINAVDKFIIYDDVNFIKQGWINRNRILVSDQSSYLTIPIIKTSSYKTIRETQISSTHDWQTNAIKTIEHAYRKAPFFSQIFPLIEAVLLDTETHISTLALKSILKISQYLRIDTQFVETSTIYNNAHLRGQNRVLDICKLESTSTYINPIGGIELYSKRAFLEQGIALYFIQTNYFEYKQFRDKFVPWLSIIDVLMFNGRYTTYDLLKEYCLT